MTVLLTLVAATIAFAMARQTVLQARSVTGRSDAASALDAARDALVRIEAELAADQAFFYETVLDVERARVCTLDDGATVVQPGSAWPAACGVVWTYQRATDPGPVQVELRPPSPGAPQLGVLVLARSGGTDAGLDVTYVGSAGRWVWASTDSLDLRTPGDSPASGRLEGNVYAGGTVTLPVGATVAFVDGQVAAEGGFPQAPTDAARSWFAATAAAGTPPVRDIRSVQPAPITGSSLAAAAAKLDHFRCPAGPPGTPHENLGGRHSSSHLCLKAGASLRNVSDTSVSIPAATTAYMLIPGAGGDDQVRVYATSRSIVPGDLVCSVPSCLPLQAKPKMVAGDHPGAMNFWGPPLGDFFLPDSGLISADADVYLGACSSNVAQPEYANNEVCAILTGVDPGMTIRAPVTVIAGDRWAPKDIYLGAPVTATGRGQLGLIATKQIVVPYWSRPWNAQVPFQVHALGVGLGTTGPSVIALPSNLTWTGDLLDENWASRVVFTGSVTGVKLPFGLSGVRSTWYRYDDRGRAAGPPWFSPSVQGWARSFATVISGGQLCGHRSCATW